MSGGSFDYLYVKSIDELMAYDGNLDMMADKLATLGYAEDAARETTEFLMELRAGRIRLETMQRRLSDLWKAVEWWVSGDYGEDAVKEALAKYRGSAE